MPAPLNVTEFHAYQAKADGVNSIQARPCRATSHPSAVWAPHLARPMHATQKHCQCHKWRACQTKHNIGVTNGVYKGVEHVCVCVCLCLCLCVCVCQGCVCERVIFAGMRDRCVSHCCASRSSVQQSCLCVWSKLCLTLLCAWTIWKPCFDLFSQWPCFRSKRCFLATFLRQGV